MRLTLALALLAAPLCAQEYDGLYIWDAADPETVCTMVDFGNADVEVRGTSIQFTETRCELANPMPMTDFDGTLYDAKCNGEGEVWSERMMLYRSFDGIAIISGGSVRPYRRCG